ncbi:MAG: Mrp/NBP35 family ATP-binding protein [Caldilineaceae bacterium]
MSNNQDDQTVVTEDAVRRALATVQEPELHNDLVSLNMVRDVAINGGDVTFTIVLTTPACPLQTQIEEESTAAVKQIAGVENVNVQFDSNVRSDARIASKLDVPIKNVIAVASGKGGVGKSTIATNLAVSLAQYGASVGLLDADIYGPNIPMMFGLNGPPEVRDNKLIPMEAFGVKVMSMGFLMPEGEALVWRGPMLHKAIQQLLEDVVWGELDYLIADMPPGTGDVQLSLAQNVPLTGGIIVTSPQAVSVSDAQRGATAFTHLDVPIIGVIENMSGEVFGTGGGQIVANAMGIEFLGSVDLDPHIRIGGDAGRPIVVAEPESETAKALRMLARKIAARISVLSLAPKPELRVS